MSLALWQSQRNTKGFPRAGTRGNSGRSGAGVGAYIALTLVTLVPTAALAIFFWRELNGHGFGAGTQLWLTVFLLAQLLAGMLLVARWFQRLTTNSDIDELRKMAFSYRLGNTLALRAFLNEDGETLKPDSSLEEYQKGIVEPHFYKSTTNPPFYLALILVLSLGLFAFFAPILDLTSSPWIFLLGPELGDFYQNGPAGATPVMTAELAAYGARALVCLAFAFAGAMRER